MKRRNLIITLIILLLAGGGGYYYYLQTVADSAETAEEAPLQVATARQGSITISATGAGSVIPAAELALAFEQSGVLAELYVEVGQFVQAGDAIGRLDDADLQKALADAELAVEQVMLQLDEDALARSVGLAELQVEQAQLNLDIATKTLSDTLAFTPDSNQVASARLSVSLAQSNLDNTINNGTNDLSLDITSAELNLQTARNELKDLNDWAPDWDQVATLQAQLKAAQASLQNARTSADSGQDLTALTIAVDQAQRNLADAQAAYDVAFEHAREWETVSHDCKTTGNNGQCQVTFTDAIAAERASAESNLQRQQENLRIAQANLATARANNSQSSQQAQASQTASIASGEASVKSIEAQLKSVQVPPTDTEIAAAQVRVRQAELTVQQIRNNQTSQSGSYNASVGTSRIQLQQAQLNLAQAQNAVNEASVNNLDAIAQAEFTVKQAEISLRQAEINLLAAKDTSSAELNLKSAELNLAAVQRNTSSAILTAPIDGTILAVDAQVGEAVGSTAVVTLANIEQPLIEIFLDETDIANVKIGNAVDVIFDSLPEQTFSAEIVLVDPLLSVSNNVTTIRALAALSVDALTIGSQPVVVGMNGTVDVIGGQAENAILVPVEAVRELSPGQFAVFVIENEVPKLRFVEVGLQDFTFAEIISGVEQGEIVSTGIIETQ